MTLLIGIKCTDGLVIAADGATTFGTFGNFTIRQPSRKLSIVKDSMIVAVTGPVGLKQRFVGELEGLQLSANIKQHQAMESIAGAIRRPLQIEFKNAEVTRGALGGQAVQSIMSGTMVGLLVQGEPTLIEFDHQGSPECATDNLRFKSLGSGQPLADPFLAFLAKVFWSKKPPNLNDGQFAATWTLRHAIETNPGGVDDPIQMMTLRNSGKGCEIKELQKDDLQEHLEAIAAAQAHLAEFQKKQITPVPSGDIPSP